MFNSVPRVILRIRVLRPIFVTKLSDPGVCANTSVQLFDGNQPTYTAYG